MQIKKGQTIRIRRGTVQCQSGCIWLTEQGQDIILMAGESYKIRRVAIIEGLKDSSLMRGPGSRSSLGLPMGSEQI